MIYFAKRCPEAYIPKKRNTDAGFDIRAILNEDIYLYPGQTKMFGTGISSFFSNNYVFKLENRSSLGKKGLHIAGGIIDASYQGEIKVCLTNTTKNTLFIFSDKPPKYNTIDSVYEHEWINTNNAICQGILYIIENRSKEISLEDLLKIPSERGQQGFGSTNNK